MRKILDYFYSLLETYGGKVSTWSWNKRWKNAKEKRANKNAIYRK